MGGFSQANQLTLESLSRDSYNTSQQETSRLPVLSEKKDPWDQPFLGKRETTTNSTSKTASGYSGYSGYGTRDNTSGTSSSNYYSTQANGIPGKVDKVCKNLLSAARSLPSSHLDIDMIKEEDKKVKGFWGGVKSFLTNDTTKEVMLVMGIITLKTMLVYAYVKADQRKIKVAEFI